MPAQTTRIAPASPGAIEEASAVLAAGGLVAFPTETVYGLGADATNDAAVARLYAAKERPSFNPLIVHVTDLAAAERIAVFEAQARALAGAFWPGPLTLVVRKRPAARSVNSRRRGSTPSPSGCRAIRSRRPFSRRSESRWWRRRRTARGSCRRPPPSTCRPISPAVSISSSTAGRRRSASNSTILACIDGRVTLLRPGAVAREDIVKFLGHDIASPPAPHASAPSAGPIAPGMLASHYAPRAAVRLNARAVAPGEALLAFGPALPTDAAAAAAVLNLSERGDTVEAAAKLFAYLRRLDATGVATIAVMPIPEQGLGEAINDRLRRAAAPRAGATQAKGFANV